ncbi:S9 family peptidase [Acetobacteraceae bacterium]|nr:S9 family peptidase [Acetobacteraceae bacterium]
MTLLNSPSSDVLLTPPKARKEDHSITQLGRTRNDPYAWMKDENWQELLTDPTKVRPDIKEHLEAENTYTKAVLKGTEALQKTLFEEMKKRLPPKENGVPRPDGAYAYTARFEEGAQHPLHIRHKVGTGTDPLENMGPEEILLDEAKEAEGKAFYHAVGFCHSQDHRFYAWGEDTQGSEIYQIKVREIATGEFVGKPVEGSTGDFILTPDNQWIFWIWRDENGRPRKLFRRRLGEDNDILVFEEEDQGFFLHLSLTSSKRFIKLGRGDHESSETLLIKADEPESTPFSAAPLIRGERYEIFDWQDRFLILTNRNNAVDFQILQSKNHQTKREAWEAFLPHAPGHFLLGLNVAQDWIVWTERIEGNPTLRFISFEDVKDSQDIRTKSKEIAISDPAYDLSSLGFLGFKSETIRYIWQSPSTAPHWVDENIATGEKKLRKVWKSPVPFDADQYETKRLYVKATDGEEVPVTLLMRKGTQQNGETPLLLYGYGSYGIPMEADFNPNIYSLIDRGWIFAVAHIRGGTEKGWNWFLQGRKKNKPNTFTDFVAAARYLIAEKYTSADYMVAQGGSAGGMLMGAVANLAPELFAGIVAQVPFVDVLNTMSDVDLPLTPPEWPEWGNPLKSEEDYDLIASYSPYDNIRHTDYPAILAMGGLSDPRVTYWEPAKWIARLRDEAKSGQFMCRINMESGHKGSSGRFDRLHEVAIVQAFAMWAVAQKTGKI